MYGLLSLIRTVFLVTLQRSNGQEFKIQVLHQGGPKTWHNFFLRLNFIKD